MQTVCIVGLGLMGGSLAKALKAQVNIIGVEINETIKKTAIKEKVVTKFHSLQTAVSQADIIIFCTYPKTTIDLMNLSMKFVKNNAILSDICGTKSFLYSKIKDNLSKRFRYVPIHPMAGKEIEGYEHSNPSIFKQCGYIVIQTPFSDQDGVLKMIEIGKMIGAKNISVNTIEEHDKIIAYTSDLMHIASSCLSIHYPKQMTKAHTAGAYKDMTRIAEINPSLWTELLMDNKENISDYLKQYIHHLTLFQEAIDKSKQDQIYELLSRARTGKLEMKNK